MAVEVTSEPSFRASPAQLIRGTESVFRRADAAVPRGPIAAFLSRPYDVAADRRILSENSPGAESATRDSVRLTLHFDEEIRRRLAPLKP